MNFMIRFKKCVVLFAILTFVGLLFVGASIEVEASSYISGGVNIDVDYGVEYSYRTDEYLITGASQYTQNYDCIDITDWGITTTSLAASGYSTLVLIFHLDIKEKNDGYQELYVYQTASNNASSLVSGYTNFEHDPSGVNRTYATYEFYAEINISDIINNKIYLRYSAHGFWGNKWYNKNLEVQLCASFSSRAYSQLTWVTNGV